MDGFGERVNDYAVSVSVRLAIVLVCLAKRFELWAFFFLAIVLQMRYIVAHEGFTSNFAAPHLADTNTGAAGQGSGLAQIAPRA